MALIQEAAVDPETLLRAKAMCVSTHEMALEGIAAQASSAAVNEALGLGFGYDREYPRLVEDVTSGRCVAGGERFVLSPFDCSDKTKSEHGRIKAPVDGSRKSEAEG